MMRCLAAVPVCFCFKLRTRICNIVCRIEAGACCNFAASLFFPSILDCPARCFKASLGFENHALVSLQSGRSRCPASGQRPRRVEPGVQKMGFPVQSFLGATLALVETSDLGSGNSGDQLVCRMFKFKFRGGFRA